MCTSSRKMRWPSGNICYPKLTHTRMHSRTVTIRKFRFRNYFPQQYTHMDGYPPRMVSVSTVLPKTKFTGTPKMQRTSPHMLFRSFPLSPSLSRMKPAHTLRILIRFAGFTQSVCPAIVFLVQCLVLHIAFLVPLPWMFNLCVLSIPPCPRLLPRRNCVRSSTECCTTHARISIDCMAEARNGYTGSRQIFENRITQIRTKKVFILLHKWN